MKLTFSKKPIDQLPKEYVRVRLIEGEATVRRFVREDGVEWLEIGTPKGSEMTRRTFITLCRAIVQAAKQQKLKKVAVQFDQTPGIFKGLQREISGPEDVAQLAAENFEMANYEFATFKTDAKKRTGLDEIMVCGTSSPSIEKAAQRGKTIGEYVNQCRALSNTPGGDMTPKKLAQAAKDLTKGLPVTVQVLTRAQMQKLGMGAVLGVAKGSLQEPTFTVMEYKGSAGKPIVLAGKGVTFDAGGLNLKPSSSIYEMHMDMSGGAAVMAAVALAAKLKLKKHVVGLIPAVENLPGNEAMRPGDILKSLSGKTIEVTDADAEGRLILADALTYAKRFKPSVVLDVATLTGAVEVALGRYASGLLTKDDALAAQLLALGEQSGDYLWRLPLWDEYEHYMKGTFADLQNHPIGQGRYGGATQGGIFLWNFAKELGCPWAHLDIASRMTSAHGDELAKGAAGAPVRLLISFIDAWKP